MNYENRTFECFSDRDSGATFSNIVFSKCAFEACAISVTLRPELRSTIRKVNITSCEQRGCGIYCAVFEDVWIENLKTNGLLQTWGSVFKHVTLKGRLGRLMFSQAIAPSRATLEQQRTFDEVNAAFYDNVDWAMDIREAEFEECDIRSVPAGLIQRDPETQVVVKRSNAARGQWRKLDLSKTYWHVALDLFLERGDQDIVLVAPKRHKKFRDLLQGLKMLKDIGVAEQQ